MFKVMNPEFFRVTTFSNGLSKLAGIKLINIFTDPMDFELPQYRRDPIAAIVVADANDGDIANSSDENFRDSVFKYLESHEFEKFSAYDDPKYDHIQKIFGDQCRYPTVIFSEIMISETDETYPQPRDIILLGQPCDGIMNKIPKSPFFELYSASLVVMRQSSFRWNDYSYDKLFYTLVDVTTHFQFEELINDHPFPSMVRLHQIGFLAKSPDRVSHTITDFMVDYYHRPDRKSLLYDKNPKGLFYLSDIPRNPDKNRGSVSVPFGDKVDPECVPQYYTGVKDMAGVVKDNEEVRKKCEECREVSNK